MAKKKAQSLEVEARKKLFDKDGPYSQNKQCELLGVSKSSLFTGENCTLWHWR